MKEERKVGRSTKERLERGLRVSNMRRDSVNSLVCGKLYSRDGRKIGNSTGIFR